MTLTYLADEVGFVKREEGDMCFTPLACLDRSLRITTARYVA